MAENNENRIRRRKVSSTTNNNRNTGKNSNNNAKKQNSNIKNTRTNKNKESIQEARKKREEREQFELEREIYYRKKKINRKKRLKIATKLASVFLILAVNGGIVFSGFALYAVQGAPQVTKELIRENYISSQVVSDDQIPDDLKHAVVAMEDRRFYKHHGVDIKALVRSALNNLVTSSTQGGSTIDMQVSKNFTSELRQNI